MTDTTGIEETIKRAASLLAAAISYTPPPDLATAEERMDEYDERQDSIAMDAERLHTLFFES